MHVRLFRLHHHVASLKINTKPAQGQYENARLEGTRIDGTARKDIKSAWSERNRPDNKTFDYVMKMTMGMR